MKILLTGANGYVGKRLLPELLQQGHEVTCCVRNKNRLGLDEKTLSRVKIWEVDFLRLYSYAMLPFHYFLFSGMIRNIANPKKA